ncbi:MAG: EthD family reductase [Bryobacterales bacterium]|nr:EthD family reductase [Bryobacterales bacterium]
MIRVNVLYPDNASATFDMDYYMGKHIPMVRQKLGAALKGLTIDRGLSGAQPGTQAPYRVILALEFDSVEAFEHAFGPVAGEIQGDIPRYTNIAPTIQISEVKM